MITQCKCENEPNSCDITVLERPNFFPRQLVTPSDLNEMQDYFRDRLRLRNRMMFGWGVVCGAKVGKGNRDFDPGKVKVAVSPGYILDPYGNEIYIPRKQTFTIDKDALDSARGCAGNEQSDEGTKVFIAVRYLERQTRPVRVPPAGCGCDEVVCQYARLQDCYELRTLDQCPPSHRLPDSPTPIQDRCRHPSQPCEDCPPDSWVVLAAVTVGPNDTITAGPNNEIFERGLNVSAPDLQLREVADVNEIPTEAQDRKNLVIVSRLQGDNNVHFRIFDATGKRAVDVGEATVNKPDEIAKLKSDLDSLFGSEVPDARKPPIVADVKAIVGEHVPITCSRRIVRAPGSCFYHPPVS